jgi:hypothetical protein
MKLADLIKADPELTQMEVTTFGATASECKEYSEETRKYTGDLVYSRTATISLSIRVVLEKLVDTK